MARWFRRPAEPLIEMRRERTAWVELRAWWVRVVLRRSPATGPPAFPPNDDWKDEIVVELRQQRTALRVVDESRVYRNRLWMALNAMVDKVRTGAFPEALAIGMGALAASEPPKSAELTPGDICQCPRCGRAHRFLAGGRPPQ